MSQTELRLFAAIGAAALALRLGTSVVTESHPLFPSFYYTDAQVMNDAAADDDEARRAGKPYLFPGIAGLSQRMQVALQADLYRFVGPRPLAVKLIDAALGALSVVVLGIGLSFVFSPGPALATAAAAAVWPSHVFYTSQNFKEAPTILLTYLGLTCGLALLGGASPRRSPLIAAAMAFFLIAAGFYRSYILLTVSVALALAFAWSLAIRKALRPSALGLLGVLLALALYVPASRCVLDRWLTANGLSSNGDPRLSPRLIPVTIDHADVGVTHSPTSPQGLSEFRRSRQYSDRRWAELFRQREIGTQLFPDARFRTWLDVLVFIPKSSFYVLFMPLPGLYPIDGKIGRMLAAIQNLVLLAVAILGVVGALRGPRTPARAALLLFFLAMTAGCALLEFDLGSAERHKLLYLPMLFPFAAEEFFRLLGDKARS